MTEMCFAWDEAKAEENGRKHGISFEEASTILADENARLKHGPDRSQEEGWFLLLGPSARLRLLLVCDARRENDEVIRIISARKATPNGSGQYGSYS